ncbi:MAG: type 11 methyltransferase [Paenibacillaceae bacterium]|nr:type 11 methyltransferase [Paenibacillaceae bacterium]
MSDYWSDRFKEGGMIWGTDPSPTAVAAKELFKRHGATRILVPGAGYGRNTRVFSREAGMRTEAVELSGEAIALAAEWDPDTLFRQGSVLEPSIAGGLYDGIYAYDVIHLFLQEEREQLVANCFKWLACGGLIYLTCFSDEDSHYGQGEQIEEGTYAYMPGKYAHFFTGKELVKQFAAFEVLEAGSVDETLRYGDNREKTYKLRYLTARKP